MFMHHAFVLWTPIIGSPYTPRVGILGGVSLKQQQPASGWLLRVRFQNRARREDSLGMHAALTNNAFGGVLKILVYTSQTLPG